MIIGRNERVTGRWCVLLGTGERGILGLGGSAVEVSARRAVAPSASDTLILAEENSKLTYHCAGVWSGLFVTSRGRRYHQTRIPPLCGLRGRVQGSVGNTWLRCGMHWYTVIGKSILGVNMRWFNRIARQHRDWSVVAGFVAAGAILVAVGVAGSPTSHADLDNTIVQEFDQATNNVTQAGDMLKDAPTDSLSISALHELSGLESAVTTLNSDISGTEPLVEHVPIAVQTSPLVVDPPELMVQVSQQFLDAVEGFVAADSAGDLTGLGLVEHVLPIAATGAELFVADETVADSTIAAQVIDFFVSGDFMH